ncbi:MAG: BamA/TamA family outer membrane protein [Ignavibacteria bacterium]|jgi:outer membrane protein assembly factor BamA|nr:BamA/TamA family outer membrane protein [Ignavibacteria bacterium]MDH7527912.1 BamA/TamA family outer membrane protein [Ignavibacteria bacterium]
MKFLSGILLIILVEISFAQDYELSNIKFEGNKNFSSGVLKEILISQETPFWFWKFLNRYVKSLGKPPIYFDSLNINEDIRRIERFYRDNGFFDCSVSARYQLNDKNKKAELIFQIDEGERSRISSYRYYGIDSAKIGSWLYLKILKEKKIEEGNFFQREKIENDASRIVSELRNFGFMLADRDRIVATIDSVKKTVDVEITFKPNRYFTVSEVRVEKSGIAKDNVEDEFIYKLVGIKSGEKYSHSKNLEGQLRLYRTGLFTSSLVSGVVAETTHSTVPINISVDVGKMNELGPEIIVNNQTNRFNVGLGLNYTRKNFFGNARKLTIEGTVVTQDIFNINYKNVFGKNGLKDTTLLGLVGINLSIEQPYLFYKDIKGKLEFFASAEQQKFYRYYTAGSKLSFLFELPKFVMFNNYSLYLGYESENISFKPQLPFDYIKGILINSGFPISPEDTTESMIKSESESFLDHSNTILGVDLFANHANDIFYPTSGYNLQLSLEYTGLLPYLKNLLSEKKDRNIQYYKTLVGVNVYTNPFKPSRGAVAYKLRLGYIQKIEGEKSISQNKLYYAGGSNSIRGWRARGLGPTFSFVDDQGKLITISEIGGRVLLEGSIESRNILFGDFGSALFFDFGNSWRDLKSVSLKTTALTFGFGFRYYTSFAPIRIDIGTQLYDPYSYRFIFKRVFLDAVQFHLGIGEAF